MRCSAAACLLRLKGSSAPEAARARAWPEALPNGASAFARSSIFVMPLPRVDLTRGAAYDPRPLIDPIPHRSEEHTSELQSLMRISYAGFCLKKKQKNKINTYTKNPS